MAVSTDCSGETGADADMCGILPGAPVLDRARRLPVIRSVAGAGPATIARTVHDGPAA